MRKLCYFVSAAAIATGVAAFAVPASAQPFSGVMGSWGYGGYGAFHMVLWVLILIALIFGVPPRRPVPYTSRRSESQRTKPAEPHADEQNAPF